MAMEEFPRSILKVMSKFVPMTVKQLADELIAAGIVETDEQFARDSEEEREWWYRIYDAIDYLIKGGWIGVVYEKDKQDILFLTSVRPVEQTTEGKPVYRYGRDAYRFPEVQRNGQEYQEFEVQVPEDESKEFEDAEVQDSNNELA